MLAQRLVDGDCGVYELEAAEEMPCAEFLAPLNALRAEAERTRPVDSFWYSSLVAAIDACEAAAAEVA